MGKIRVFFENHREVLAYLFFGVLTTAVNYAVYLPFYNLLGFSAAVSNMIAWAASVTFAYLTNKPFVYRSGDWSAATVVPEVIKFVGSRVISGMLETVIIFVTVDCLLWNGNVMKFVTAVLVVILNYIAGKRLVFRK